VRHVGIEPAEPDHIEEFGRTVAGRARHEHRDEENTPGELQAVHGRIVVGVKTPHAVVDSAGAPGAHQRPDEEEGERTHDEASGRPHVAVSKQSRDDAGKDLRIWVRSSDRHSSLQGKGRLRPSVSLPMFSR
jgi:hypothetical protein